MIDTFCTFCIVEIADINDISNTMSAYSFPTKTLAKEYFRKLIKEYDPTLYDEDINECEAAGEFENGGSYVRILRSK